MKKQIAKKAKLTNAVRNTPQMNCGGKKNSGCFITLMPHFVVKKAA